MTTDPQTDRTAAIYDSLDAFQRTHRLPGLQHAQIRGLLAEHLARALPAAVSVSAAAPPTDRAGLRDRIAEALKGVRVWRTVDGCDGWEYAGTDALTEAVAAILLPPADRAATDRAYEIRLREATSGAVAHMQDVEPNPELTTDSYADGWNECLADVRAAVAGELPLPYRQIVEWAFAERLAVQLANCCEECDGCIVIARRLAAETAGPETQGEAHPPEHTWAAELHDPQTDEWVPGTRFLVREGAVNALEHGRKVGPAWKDGTPTMRRLVRATTTYTVEPDAAAPAAAQTEEA